MAFLGYLGWKHGSYSLYFSFASAVAGTFTGSMLAYFIGYRYGENFLLKYGKYVHITKTGIDSTKKLFVKHERLLLLFGRFVTGVRHLVPYISGISKIELKTYMIYNLIGSILWCTAFYGLGYVMGDKWALVEELAREYSIVIILLGIFAFIVYRYFNKYKKAIYILAVPLLIFVKLSEDLIGKELSVFDSTIYLQLTRFINPHMTVFMKAITICGSGVTLILVSFASILLFRRNKWAAFYGYMVPVNLVASSLMNETFKIIFHRQRPDILRLVYAGGFSFPSGHSMISLCFYGFIIYLCIKHMRRSWKYLIAAILSILVFLIGLSRIYLGVHYASDVLAGFSAGFAWLVIFIMIIERICKQRTGVCG